MATVAPAIAAQTRGIPTTLSASFRSWWASNEKEAAASEERLFSRIPFFIPSSTPALTESTLPLTARLSRVELSTPKRFLNMLSILPTNPSPNLPPPTVVLPGYGAGIGFFYLNFPALGEWAARRGASVYGLDWLGMGRSARVPFKIHAKGDDLQGRVTEAEDFFLDALEEWRAKMGFEKITLVGHSLGAYLSTAYALRHPNRVSRLILLSPAGVPEDPDLTVSAEVDPSPETALNSTNGDSNTNGTASKAQVRDVKKEQAERRKNQSNFRKAATFLWESGFSPFQIVRSTLFYGPMLVGKYSSRRFPHLPQEDVVDMHEYIWHITRAKGSGEYGLSHILAPGAFARLALVNRISGLKMPITFVYGDHDWMDPEGGQKCKEKLEEAGNKNVKVAFISRAGHHLYLDNPKAMNKLLVSELDKECR